MCINLQTHQKMSEVTGSKFIRFAILPTVVEYQRTEWRRGVSVFASMRHKSVTIATLWKDSNCDGSLKVKTLSEPSQLESFVMKPTYLSTYICLSNAILTDYIIALVSVRVCVCVCVCPPIGCRTITSAILYRFSPNFACRSEMRLFRTLLFLEQTGSSLPILAMRKIQFWQFRDCGGHIFSRIVIKTWIEI